MKCLHSWGWLTGKLRMKFFYVFVPIMFSICFHMFPIMFPKFLMFSILLIEEKVMSYVTVSEGHGHPLVKIILNVGVIGPSRQKQGTWYHFELLLHIKCKKLNRIACKRFVNL
jgi:hypothetical protein